jgi:hypothetical protein
MIDIDRSEAAKALSAYRQLQDKWLELDAQQRAQPTLDRLSPPHARQGLAALAELITEARNTKDEMLRKADHVDELLKRVKVPGFNPHIPEDTVGRNAVVRAIGQYVRWIETGIDPNPPASPPVAPAPLIVPASADADAETRQRKTPARARRGAPWWVTISLPFVSAAIVALWGETKTCEPNIQRECKASDGGPGAQFCAPNGRGWSNCEGFTPPQTAQPCIP